MTADFDVVVVGFGPTGAVAAGLLGQAGLRTLVIDRSHEVWDKPRAIAIDHEIMRVLQNLGVADRVLPHVAPFPASEHFGAQGQLIRRIDMVPPPYPLGYVPSMVFTQPPVEAALRAHVGGYPGVEIGLGTSFRSLQQSANNVTLELQGPNGPRRVTGRYVIAADGASSPVRQALGIAYEDLVFDEPWMVIDVLVNDDALARLPATAAQFCEPDRPSTYIVGPGHHRRWEIMLQEDEDPRTMEQPDRVWSLLARWLTPRDGRLWRASSYRFHALVAREWRQGRVFLAGDAAHQQPPFIGQGMCQGVRDAANVAWKLRSVCAGEASDVLLDTYAEERGRHVRTLTSRIKAIGHMICERDPEAARRRDENLLLQGGGVAPTITRQEIVPGLECGLLAGTAHPANGTLFPQPWIAGGQGPVRMDTILGDQWRVIWDGRQVGAPPALDLRSARVLPAPEVEDRGALIEQDGVVGAWFDRHGCLGAVLRPDHYVFGVLHAPAAAVLMLDALARRMGSPVQPLAAV